MESKNKLRNAILAVVAIIIFTTGTTYSYFHWTINQKQEINVEFTIDNMQEGIYASIEGNGIIDVEKLQPTQCTNKTNIVFKEINIKYKNQTTQTANVIATLTTTTFNIRSTSYVPTAENLKYLKYSLTTTDKSCKSNIAQDLDGNELAGDFSGLTFNEGEVSNLPLTLFNQTFNIPANMTEEQTPTYYLWIWWDYTYEHENVGDDNTDPLQGLTFELEWSGKIEQKAF